MAVKKHELVHDSRLQPDLAALEKYLQLMNEQHSYLPPPGETVKTCQDIVKCLSRASGNEEELWLLLQAVEEFLIRIMNTVTCELRQEVVTAILEKFYSLISDPQTDACPAASTVLVVVDGLDNGASISAARWLVQERDNGPGGAELRSALSCLFRWMSEWHGTSSFGEWILSYIKALEENDRFDILIEVSLDNLACMFSALERSRLRHATADVIFHVLASLRDSTDALDRISPHVGHVLTQLAADSGQWSRTVLQNIVDIVSGMIDCLIDPLQGDAKNEFRAKYADVIGCLERHMASRGCRFLQVPPWRPRDACVPRAPSASRMPIRKVGLINLGNTCYMNSVMQALLVTRQFSTHVMLKMNGVPYWSNVSMLFAKMLYSISTKLNPEEFFTVVKPPFFTTDIQHDSSEFLGYLFELLTSYEHSSDLNHDYSKPAVLNSANRGKSGPLALQSNSDNSRPGTSSNRRSVSPRPGSSAAGSSSSMKRYSPEHELSVPPKKRMRITESVFLRRDSFIDSLFGGVLLTRVQCTHCHSSSLSRDVFRDLQLAFPEETDSEQHSVQSLLEFYCSKERLTGDNKYQCGDCGVLRDAERSVLIETTPKHLILVLKHFKFDAKLQVQSKLCYPMDLDNTNVTLPTVRSQADHAKYSLYAAIIHSGSTLNSGHYYTLAKDDDTWFMCNDDVVSESAESKLAEESSKGATPYILFYKRSDVEVPAAPALEEAPQALQQMILAHNKHYVETVRQVHITRP